MLFRSSVLLFAAGLVGDLSTRTWTYQGNGCYLLGLLASDTANLGQFVIGSNVTGAVPRSDEFMVASVNWFAGAFGTTPQSVNVTQIAGVTNAAAGLAAGAIAVVPVTITAGSSTTVIATNLTNAISGTYVGRTLTFTAGSIIGQSTTITAYNASTGQLTVAAVTNAPIVGDTAVIT